MHKDSIKDHKLQETEEPLKKEVITETSEIVLEKKTQPKKRK